MLFGRLLRRRCRYEYSVYSNEDTGQNHPSCHLRPLNMDWATLHTLGQPLDRATSFQRRPCSIRTLQNLVDLEPTPSVHPNTQTPTRTETSVCFRCCRERDIACRPALLRLSTGESSTTNSTTLQIQSSNHCPLEKDVFQLNPTSSSLLSFSRIIHVFQNWLL